MYPIKQGGLQTGQFLGDIFLTRFALSLRFFYTSDWLLVIFI